MRQAERCCSCRIVETLNLRAIAPVHLHDECVQSTGIGNCPAQTTHSVFGHRRGRQPRENRRHIADRHHCAAQCTAAIVVGNSDNDGVTVCGIVVEVLVRLGETCRPGGIVETLQRATVTPVDLQSQRVQRARIGDRPAQRAHTILGRRRGGQSRQNRRHIADRHHRAGCAAIAIVVGDRHADGVAVRSVIIRVLMCLSETGRPRGIAECLHPAAITPVDLNGERVQSTWVRDRSAQRARTILDRRRSGQAQDAWRDIDDGHHRAGRGAAAVVVGDRHGNRVVICRVVVQVLVCLGKARRPSRIVERLKRRAIAPIYLQRERVQHTRIGDHPGQRTDPVLADRRSGQTGKLWCDVRDGD